MPLYSYLAKPTEDTGQPYPVRAASRREAARIIARGTRPVEDATISVWTEAEWRDRRAGAEYVVTEDARGQIDVETW